MFRHASAILREYENSRCVLKNQTADEVYICRGYTLLLWCRFYKIQLKCHYTKTYSIEPKICMKYESSGLYVVFNLQGTDQFKI
jgi:hypothetical protein